MNAKIVIEIKKKLVKKKLARRVMTLVCFKCFRILFQRITKAEHTGRNCTLRVVNDNAGEMDLVFRHSTPSMANAMYRSVTEMHSFFFCDTVHDEVSEQFSRDLKGTLASLFNEHTTLGMIKACYMFIL